MIRITCFFCHKPGHIAAFCKTNQIKSNQQRMQTVKRLPQANTWRRQPFIRYANCFYGYCFYCKEFGHKVIECRTYGQRLMFKTSRRFMNHGEFTRTHNSAKNMINCCVCHKIGHMSSQCPLNGCGPSSQNRCQKNRCLQWKKKLNKCDLALISQD